MTYNVFGGTLNLAQSIKPQPAYIVRTWTREHSVVWFACLLLSFRWYSVHLAELIRVVGYVLRWVTHSSTNRAECSATTLSETTLPVSRAATLTSMEQ